MRFEAPLGQASELGLQNLAWRLDHRLLVEPAEVGHHEGGAGLPRHEAEGIEVGDHRHVAVSALPGRDAITTDRVHLHVDCEQVVAAFGSVRRDLVDEEIRRDPFADEAALHVGECEHDRVDLALLHERFEFAQVDLSGTCRHRHSLPSAAVVDRNPTIGARGCSPAIRAVMQCLHPKVDMRYQ